MTTEDLIETFIQEGIKAYKKLNRNTYEGRRLSQKIPVIIEGIEFSSWREYATYKTAERLRELLPSVSIEVTLDSDNTTLQIEVDDKEQRKINSAMFNFLHKLDIV